MRRTLALIAIAAAFSLSACGTSTPTVAQRCHTWAVVESRHMQGLLSPTQIARTCREHPRLLKEKP